MTVQIRSSFASISPSERSARSLTSISSAMESPVRSHCTSNSSPLPNGSGTSGAAVAADPLSSSERCTAPPPIEYISSVSKRRALRVPRGEAHAVRVPRQHLVAMEQEVHRLVEVDLATAEQAQAARLADARERRLHDGRIELRRIVPLEPEQDGAIRAVAEAGQRERTVELDEDFRRRRQQPARLEVEDEESRGEHRSHGVRRGRADADLEDIEDGEIHSAARRRRISAAISSASATRSVCSSCSFASTADSS